jgi:hypothetical protein
VWNGSVGGTPANADPDPPDIDPEPLDVVDVAVVPDEPAAGEEDDELDDPDEDGGVWRAGAGGGVFTG